MTPEVSVVMGVYNGGVALAQTIESVLSQEGVNFELIIVNDGSTDGTLKVLEKFRTRDSRIKIIDQENVGLTKALVTGCAVARGKILARIDNGDMYLPNKLKVQTQFLKSNPEVVMVSCGTRFVTGKNELLYEVSQQKGQLSRGLNKLNPKSIEGPSHHGSTAFLRASYEAVGGYRPNFYVAQDLDLWLRLAEIGKCESMPKVYYQAQFQPSAISNEFREAQLDTTRIILALTKARRAGLTEDLSLVPKSVRTRKRFHKPKSSIVESKGWYFIGSNLSNNRDPSASAYFLKAWKSNPLNVKAAIRFFYGLRFL